MYYSLPKPCLVTHVVNDNKWKSMDMYIYKCMYQQILTFIVSLINGKWYNNVLWNFLCNWFIYVFTLLLRFCLVFCCDHIDYGFPFICILYMPFDGEVFFSFIILYEHVTHLSNPVPLQFDYDRITHTTWLSNEGRNPTLQFKLRVGNPPYCYCEGIWRHWL